jgi:sec-independent protein translocase protein TatB
MFDIGPSELLVIFVVALLVIGPERLPSAVRTASLWVGRFRRSFHKIKADVERELNADEIRRQLHNESILAEVEDAKKQAKEFASDIEKAATSDPGKPRQTDTTGAVSGSENGPGPTASQADKQNDAEGTNDKPEATIKSEIQQAVSYVNDISREVKASKQEIEEEFSKSGQSRSGNAGDKS